MSDYLCIMPFNRELFRADREEYGSRDKLAGAIGTTGTTIQNWETTETEPGLYLLEKAAIVIGYGIGRYMDKVGTEMKPSEIDMEEFKELPRSMVEKILNTPFRASIDPVVASTMTDEEITAAIEETEKRIYLYELHCE